MGCALLMVLTARGAGGQGTDGTSASPADYIRTKPIESAPWRLPPVDANPYARTSPVLPAAFDVAPPFPAAGRPPMAAGATVLPALPADNVPRPIPHPGVPAAQSPPTTRPVSLPLVSDPFLAETLEADTIAEEFAASPPPRDGQIDHDRRRFGGWHLFGWVQDGFTWNPASPSDGLNRPLMFNDQANDLMMNQLYLGLEKPLAKDGTEWEIGGRVDLLYGSDARFVTASGWERNRDGTEHWNGENQLYHLAIPQAYVELAAPWGDGLSVRAGHFYASMGYEQIAAPENFFYSHAYQFVYGEPFTFTGAVAAYRPASNVVTLLGFTAGWDNVDSDADPWGVLGAVGWESLDQRTTLILRAHSGADITGVRMGGHRTDDARHFVSLLFQQQVTDRLRYIIQPDFGYQEGARVVVNMAPMTITFDTAKWYGINQYLIYQLDPQLAAGLRMEWFRDQDHSRIAVPIQFNPGGSTFLGGDYVAITAGLNWKPTERICLRPEVRWDWSNFRGNGAVPGGNAGMRAFDDGHSSQQWTLAMDVILSF
ncbi:MAG: outer membrane beta-barrel protein [Pirellulaceae bacterium]